MVVLHIASIKNNKFNGVHVAVPQHIYWQQQFENVAVINLTNVPVEGAVNQFEYTKPFSLSSLPEPFCAPDLVVFHEIYKFDYVVLSKHLRNIGVPYIVIPHGSLTKEAQRKKWHKKIPANVLLFNAFINGAMVIQYISEHEKDNSTYKKTSIVATHGLKISNRAKEAWNETNVNIVYIGRIEIIIKGLDLMLQAISLAANKLRDERATLNIYGPDLGKRKQILSDMIKKLEIEDLVFLNEPVFEAEKEDILIASDLFLQTSRSEALCLGALEAIGYGIPTIVTEGTTLGDIVREYDAGWVAETNAESISDAILKAITERHLWTEKSKNARKLLADNFAWEKITKDTLEQYGKVVSSYLKGITE